MESERTLDYGTGARPGLNLSAADSQYLNESAKWANFLAIVGFIGLGLSFLLFLIAGIGVMFAQGATGIVFFLFTIGMLAVYLFPLLYLYRFAKSTKIALSGNSPEALTTGLMNMKSYFKFIAILTIIMLVLSFLMMFILPSIFAVLATSMGGGF